MHDEHGKVVYRDSWKRIHPDLDKNIDYKKYDYKSLDELINWRLYNRTGAGLMAELGSHQLDACSIFLGKKHPLAVTGIGGTFFYTDGREVDDHVFTLFEFPGKGGERPGRRHLFIDQHQFVRRLRRDGDGLEGHDDREPGEGDPALQGSRQSEPRRARRASPLESQGKKPALETSPSRPARPRRLALGTWPRPIRRAAIAKSSSTSPTACATATRRIITTTRITSRAAAARSRWPTPSSR